MLPPDSLMNSQTKMFPQTILVINIVDFCRSASKILHFEGTEKCLNFGRKEHQRKNSNLV